MVEMKKSDQEYIQAKKKRHSKGHQSFDTKTHRQKRNIGSRDNQIEISIDHKADPEVSSCCSYPPKTSPSPALGKGKRRTEYPLREKGTAREE